MTQYGFHVSEWKVESIAVSIGQSTGHTFHCKSIAITFLMKYRYWYWLYF